MRVALLGAILADLGAQTANRGGVLAANRHYLDAGVADRRAFQTAFRAVVMRVHP